MRVMLRLADDRRVGEVAGMRHVTFQNDGRFLDSNEGHRSDTRINKSWQAHVVKYSELIMMIHVFQFFYLHNTLMKIV